MSKKLRLLALGIIIILAFFLRFYKISSDPPSLNWDEVSIGYNAYSILKTGRDEWGVRFPLHFKSYGEYKLPAQIYASIPGIAVFGLNEVGVRITPVVYGTLTVLFLYFLAKALTASELVALISSFLLAISPWHIQLTRASFESSFSVFWVTLGIWLLVKGFKKPSWWIISCIPFAISVYTYNSARVFTPLFLLAIALIYRKDFLKHKREAFTSGILFATLMLPLVPFVLSGEASARYRLVSITDDTGLVPRIEERRNLSKLPKPITVLIHNRVTYVSYYFAQNYLAHFSPSFLFINGAPHRQHHVQNVGELYAIQAPFLLVGLYYLFKKRQKYRWLIISWILISIIPVSITNDSIPNALRTLIANPPYQILTALGVYAVYRFLKGKGVLINYFFWGVVISILSISFYGYLSNYYYIYPVNYSRDWQYGYKQAVNYIGENKDKYDLVVFSRTYGEPHMFTLFYLNYDPAKYQTDKNLVRFESNDWVWVTNFDKFYFPDLGDAGTHYADIIEKFKDKTILFVGKSGDFPPGIPRLKTVNFLNGTEAFEIVEYK
jgi:4-amino-4-deoxy-L-arabinose transferase-like glycosyltransferase